MSFYRTAIFGVKGLSEYTRGGYESAAKKFNPDDLNVDLSNQHIMITGANSVTSPRPHLDPVIVVLFAIVFRVLGK